MRSVKRYLLRAFNSALFSALLLGMVALSACSKFEESADYNDVMDEGEGAVALSCSLSSVTRSVSDEMTLAEAEERLESYILKIYSVDETGAASLIRYYKPAYEVPEVLYLMSGDYRATLSMQVDAEPVYATRETLDFTYEGESDFTISEGKHSDVVISCGLVNSVVRMQLDSSDFATNSDGVEYTFDSSTGMILIDGEGSTTDDNNVVVKNIVGYVTAESCGSAEEVMKSAEGMALSYNFIDGSGAKSDESGVDFICDDGYFMLYDYNTSLSYAISFDCCDKLDGEFKTYSSFGKIAAVQPQTIYTLALSCSDAAKGSANLSIKFSEVDYTESNDNFSFSPQPTITGDGIGGSFDYIGGDITYSLSAVMPLSSVTVERDGVAILAMSGGAAVEGVDGVVMDVAADNMSATLTLSSDFYGGFNAGGENGYKITATDDKGAVGYVTPAAKLTGMLTTLSDANYWLNTGSLTAYIAESSAAEAKVYCRRLGGDESDWQELAMTSGAAQGENEAKITAVWSDGAANKKGNTCYTLDFGVLAQATYETKLEVDGVQRGGVVEITAGGTKDTIPYASMDNSGLSCFGSSNSSTTSWGSGNNSNASSLCTHSTAYGDGCAYLKAKSNVTLVDIAPGNLFLGQFELTGIISANGQVSFGQSFTWNSRPTSFKFRYKGTVGKVNVSYYDSDCTEIEIGDQDVMTIYLAIVDWSSRHATVSGLSLSGVWDPESDTSVDSGNVIGYAMLDIDTTTNEFVECEIPVYYYDTVTKPSKTYSIVVNCATSKYGDYLTGCDTNEMWIDNFELGY
ncbi:MAG: PCMD domain-containing protein [Rikenellaceae bacterium]